jgi:hypothetical protein
MMDMQKILTNKTVLYIVLFLALANILGFITMRDEKSVIFFVAISLLMSYFTSNMIVVLGTALILTNFLKVSNKRNFGYLEGMENEEGGLEDLMEESGLGGLDLDEDSEEDLGNDSEDDTEDDLAEEGFTLFEGFEGGKGRKGGGSRRVKKSKEGHRLRPGQGEHHGKMNERDANNDLSHKVDRAILDSEVEKTNLHKRFVKTQEDKRAHASSKNKLKEEMKNVDTMKTKDRSTFKNRGAAKSQPLKPQSVEITDDPDQEFIDHSATLEAAYDNMEKILGSEGIKNLTNDTQNLIKQQKGLTEHMGSMLPIVTQASKMLEKFDLNALTKISNIGKKKE